MKIYFAGSIRGGRENAGIYAQLIDFLKQFGDVLTCHVGDIEVRKSEKQFTEKEIHDRDINWLLQADVVIAEVSTPSLGVGYEIGRAVEAGKPILCLYNSHADFELSALISGCTDLDIILYNHLSETYPGIEKFFRSREQGAKSLELRAEGEELRAESGELRAEGEELRAEGEELRAKS